MREGGEFGLDPSNAVRCFLVSYGFVVVDGGGSGGLVSFVGAVAREVSYCSTVEAGVACLSFDVCCVASEASSSSSSSSPSSSIPCSGSSYIHGDWLVVHGTRGIGGIVLGRARFSVPPVLRFYRTVGVPCFRDKPNDWLQGVLGFWVGSARVLTLVPQCLG